MKYSFIRNDQKFTFNTFPLFLQITDNNYQSFLESWRVENKPTVLLFDQVPVIPLLYKVSNVFSHSHTREALLTQNIIVSTERGQHG